MTLQSIAGIVVTLALSDILVAAAPGFSFGNIRFGSDQVFDNDYENVNSKIYNIITKVGTSKGECVKHVTATGNGVGDVFDLPCSPNGVLTITSDKIMIYGSPNKDSFSLFSDSPSKLTVFLDNKCTERNYRTVTRKTFAEISDVSDEDCTKLRRKIDYIIEEDFKYLEVLDKHIDEEPNQKVNHAYNPAKSAFKSLSETASALRNQQNGDYSYGSPSTSSDPSKNESPLSLYSQYQEASKNAGNNQKPENQQEVNPNSVTVTETLSTPNKETVSVTHQETPNYSLTVTEQVSTPNKETVTESHQDIPSNSVAVSYGSSSTSNEPSKHDSPLGLYSQFQEASTNGGNNQIPESVSHQDSPANSVTVTEQLSTPNKETVSVTHQETPLYGVTVTEQTSTSNTAPAGPEQQDSRNNQGSNVEEVSFYTGDHTVHSNKHKSASLDSYLESLAAKYSKLKTKVVDQVHKKQADGWEFSALNNFLHGTHSENHV